MSLWNSSLDTLEIQMASTDRIDRHDLLAAEHFAFQDAANGFPCEIEEGTKDPVLPAQNHAKDHLTSPSNRESKWQRLCNPERPAQISWETVRPNRTLQSELDPRMGGVIVGAAL